MKKNTNIFSQGPKDERISAQLGDVYKGWLLYHGTGHFV